MTWIMSYLHSSGLTTITKGALAWTKVDWGFVLKRLHAIHSLLEAESCLSVTGLVHLVMIREGVDVGIPLR